MMRQAKSGFTLLELMIAVFILAVGVSILLGTESTSMGMMGYANSTSVVTMLTRSKMQDIEYEVQHQIKKEEEEGLQEDYRESYSGTFKDEGYDDITWEARVESIELSDDASNSFVESVTEQIYGNGEEGGTLSGNTTVTQFLPTMVGFLPAVINQLGQRIRKITLTTTWDYLGVEQTLTVSEYVVILDAPNASGSSVSGSVDENGDAVDDDKAIGDTISAGNRTSGTSSTRNSGSSGGSGGDARGDRGGSGGSGGSRGGGSGGSRGGGSGGSRGGGSR